MLKGKDAIQQDLWSTSAPFSLWTINIVLAASLCPLQYKGIAWPLTKSLLQNQAGNKNGKAIVQHGEGNIVHKKRSEQGSELWKKERI